MMYASALFPRSGELARGTQSGCGAQLRLRKPVRQRSALRANAGDKEHTSRQYGVTQYSLRPASRAKAHCASVRIPPTFPRVLPLISPSSSWYYKSDSDQQVVSGYFYIGVAKDDTRTKILGHRESVALPSECSVIQQENWS